MADVSEERSPELALYRAQLRVAAFWLYLGSMGLVQAWAIWSRPNPRLAEVEAVLATGMAVAMLIRRLPWKRWPAAVFLTVAVAATAQISALQLLAVPGADDLLIFVAIVGGLYSAGWELAAVLGLLIGAELALAPGAEGAMSAAVLVGSALLSQRLFVALRELTRRLEVKVVLRTAEWRQTFDSMLPAVLVLSREGRVLRANAAAAHMMGGTPADLKARRCWEVVPPGLCFCGECRVRRGDWPEPLRTVQRVGETWYQVSLNPSPEHDRVIWQAMDITAEKRAERQATERGHRLSLLYGLAELLGNPGEAAVTMRRALDFLLPRLGELLGVGEAVPGGVFLRDEAAQVLRLTAAAGLPAEFAVRDARVPWGKCMCGTAAQRGQLLIASEDAPPVKLRGYCCARSLGEHTHVSVPLVSEAGVEGVLFLHFPRSRSLGEEEQALLHSVGELLGMALRAGRLYEATRFLAVHDGLTGMTNHREFQRRLRQEVARARRYGHALSLLMVDIDHFKQINDTLGHPEGDRVLAELGRRLRRECRETDLAARYGGEEFTVLLLEQDGAAAVQVAERLRRAVEQQAFPVGEGTVPVTISVGVGSLEEGMGPEELLATADRRMYAAKAAGRNQVCFQDAPESIHDETG